MLVPLGLAFQQIQILQQRLPPPNMTDLFIHRPVSDWPGAILAIPLVVWFVRRLLGRFFPENKVWGVERPALETWTAILAFAPLVGWLGNPAWWRDTLPRLAHYYTLTADREHSLPDIQIIYFGQIYEFSLPWHNAWVLIGITVPVAILGAGVIGLFWAIGQIRRDRLPFYFLVHFLTLPVIRMFPTPAHDGVRLFLPTFFFLAAFAGWGTIWLADALARAGFASLPVQPPGSWPESVLGSAAFSLVRIHPYELSYYNELIRRPARGVGTGLRADLLVRCLHRQGDRRPQPRSFLLMPRSTISTTRSTPPSSSFRNARCWAVCGGTSSSPERINITFLTYGS